MDCVDYRDLTTSDVYLVQLLGYVSPRGKVSQTVIRRPRTAIDDGGSTLVPCRSTSPDVPR